MDKNLITEIRRLLRFSGAKVGVSWETKDGIIFETKHKRKKYKVFIVAA